MLQSAWWLVVKKTCKGDFVFAFVYYKDGVLVKCSFNGYWIGES